MTQTEKEVKVSLFANNMIVYVKNPKTSIRKVLQLINTFRNMAVYKISTRKPVAFLYTYDEQTNKVIKKIISFTIA